jgi:MoaA/NifB/PqqE/SkfB family radical SAM enzyme
MDLTRFLNNARIRESYDKRRDRSGDGPIEAYVEVSARCNLRCPMCAVWVDPRFKSATARPPLLATSLFDKLHRASSTLCRVNLFGLGEPLLHPGFCRFARWLAGAGVGVWSTTNGTLIDDEMAENLGLSGLETLTISVDGASARTYEPIRRGARFVDLVEVLGLCSGIWSRKEWWTSGTAKTCADSADSMRVGYR